MMDDGTYMVVGGIADGDLNIYVTENGAGKKDGSSWENAIAGNNIYDVNQSNPSLAFINVLTTDSRYAGLYNSNSCPYGETSNHSKTFLQANKYSSDSYINITNNRDEQYVSGLQYAVEKASAAATDDLRVQVWVAGGTYTDWKGFVIRDKVEVYGGFPNEGTPNEDDREALFSQYVPSKTETAGLDYKKYETILQVRTTPTATWSGNSVSLSDWNNLPANVYRKPVLFQPDVCVTTKSTTAWDPVTGGWFDETNFTNTDRYKPGNDNDPLYVDYEGAVWDGFTIRYGYYKDYHANRDGGAGVRMFRGVTLRNCVVTQNTNYCGTYSDARNRGGGIYCDGENSSVINCFVLNNYCSANSISDSYGGGMYMILGTGYNLLVANNSAWDGGGLFIENARFYNNTVVYNNATRDGGAGGLTQWKTDGLEAHLSIYNCLFYGNAKVAVRSTNENSFENSYNCYIQTSTDLSTNIKRKFINSTIGTNLNNPFAEETNAQKSNNYRLSSSSECVNKGTEAYALPSTDVDFTNRIKDCTVDIGAYELDNEENIKCTSSNGIGTYYVSQNGTGLRSGLNPTNAACATKLQAILTDAGEKVSGGTLTSAIIKVAGYKDASFVYSANTLASAADPQSYTYVIPEGVTLMGGYYEGEYSDGVYKDGTGWDDVTTGDNVRNPMKFRTVLSAVAKSTQGSTITQEVNGYHTVTFGSWPGTTALEKETIIDGVWLTDGSATSLAGAGNPNTRGGGAIVPSGAHVRNCVVMDCEALEGGGLYLMPGATVSGTLVMNNSAENGGGVYADNTNADENSRAHILSSTIAGNSASTSGGGLYMEDGAVMNVNTVIFGNKSGSDKNVSGATNTQFADNKLSSVYDITDKTDFYPFNDCFVETQEMPSDFENTSLESDSTLYFTGNYYQLKDYSLLIKHGVKTDYQEELETTFNVTKKDMQNILRNQKDDYGATRLDAGAFAYDGGILPTDLFTRIFVSQTTNVTLPEGYDMNDYLGRSFYTSFSTLEDALGYIRSMRKDEKNADTKFEILIAGGTYKPSNERTTTAAVPHDQRLYSFEVPQGVSIYGGFDGTEKYTSGKISFIPGINYTFDNIESGDLTDILDKRTYSDFNQNNILEPWELANQTILSGQINVSSTAQNAYHVVFTDKGTATAVEPVVLDGLTVMYGQTDNKLSISTDNNEQGRGGGIYSNGVTYTISRCRLLNNTAVRGGAVFVRDADLNLSGCILAGNKTIKNEAQSTNTLTSRGGAAYVSGIDGTAYLRAANTLWANNESAGEGGAIGTNYAGVTSVHDPFIYILNNTFVRNKAAKNPVLYNHNAKSELVNTLIWGNEGANYDNATSVAEIYNVSHCASDVNYIGKFATGNSNNNILLSTDNMGDNGPRFANPTTEAGEAGNSSSSLWNPVAISVVTDAGDGTEHNNELSNTSETDHEAGKTTGTYQDWFDANSITTGYLGMNGVTEAYVTNATGTYSRYSGPRGQNNEELCKPIDIGLYEYQYVSDFSTMPAIYVDTLSRGTGSGNSWANATDDLRGAIVGAANPTDNVDKPRVVYVRDGNYSWNRTSAGSAYILNMQETNNISLTLKGSCTGSGDQQDFSKPTILRNEGSTTNLISVSANSKPVTFEGFTFINDTGTGMDASTGTDGSLTLKNCGFRISPTGLKISGNSGKVLIYNTLFADGGTGISNADASTTIVNATFANNATADMTGTAKGIYNSVSWNNKTQNLDTQTGGNNVPIDSGIDNDDVNNGPNFRDPNNADVYSRDYRIRPSVKLLNKGNKDNYVGLVGISSFDDETDLGNNARLVDTDIDVGAYEYEAPLQPIVYVKPDLTGTADGKSWETALGDLQGAVDLAGLYAMNHSADGANGYVFVHGNYNGTDNLNITLGNTKIYGSMNDERSNNSLGDSYTKTEVEAIVSELLGKRKGVLESSARSSLTNVNIGTDAVGAVVDGFTVTGAATISNGALSTSIVENNVTGTADGLLYNSLVLGDGTADHTGSVSGVKTVNVTATGAIKGDGGSGNNRYGVTETNAYVTDDYWNYQLMETATDDIDKGVNDKTQQCIEMVGHSRDLIGNLRIRNTVDNGCFETWNICKGMTLGNVITATDYPVGKSVVYVRKNQELKIENAADGTLVYKDEASAFNPGFLLLEHQAGLRGNGNYISLTNLAVERYVAEGGNDLAAMPFKVTGISPDGSDGTNESYELMRYSGSVRAAYSYQYDGTDSKAWIKSSDQDFASRGKTEGFLIENTSDNDITVRFSGNSYNEGGNDKTISLMKYNFNEPWTSTTTGGNRFTHKENMSWNLFGSPYLCAMNFSDMEYGRVIYGYEGGYKTVKTYGDDGAIVDGHIPAGSAVFTQTATLRDEEIFTVKQPGADGKSGDAFAKMAPLSVAVYPAGAVADNGVTPDILQLGAVPASEARNEFDMSADGVKWMAGGEAQIYATRSGGRYSLLSAVSIDGKVAVGVTVPEPGMYTIAVPDDCLAEDYETVVLDDAVTGRTVDLLEGGYDFTTVEEGDIVGRFNISFNRKAAAGDDIRAYFTADDFIRVEGVEPGDNISVYSVDGMRVASVTASSNVEDVRASVAVVAIVKAGGKTVKIRK